MRRIILLTSLLTLLINVAIVIMLTLTFITQAESYRSREYLVNIATMGDLVIVGKLSKIETKRDAQTGLTYTDISVEVQHVIRNVTKQDVKAGTIVYFRQLGGDTDNCRLFNLYDTTFHKDWISHKASASHGFILEAATFHQEEVGTSVILSLKRPNPDTTANSRKGFDTIFEVYGDIYGKYPIKRRNNKIFGYTPFVHVFWHERQDKEVGLPLDLVLELMNMALAVASQNPVVNPKSPEDVPEEVRIKFTRLVDLERSIRKMAADRLPEGTIAKRARKEIAKVKQELGL